MTPDEIRAALAAADEPHSPHILQAKVRILQKRVANLEARVSELENQAYDVPDLTTPEGIQLALDQAGLDMPTLIQIYQLRTSYPESDRN